MNKQESSPWCEKYRPRQIEKIVLDPLNRILFQQILETNHFPHLLFYGPPGTGKTTSIENLIRSYQDKNFKRNRETIMHLNASDERGIEIIRNQIFQFVKTKNMFEKGLKIVILDEVDYMTKNAQQALKNLLQSCSSEVRFCLICNYICKIEESLKNEFICIRFNELPKHEMVQFIQHIVEQEQIPISVENTKMIQEMFHSDIRSMINFLQLHQKNGFVTENIFHDNLFIELHTLFVKCAADSDSKPLFDWFMTKRKASPMDVKTCLKLFFRHLIRAHPERADGAMLRLAETIVHSSEIKVEHLLAYFIHHVLEHYKS